jgi:4-amino-4-deoxy-L-arabinose transferase-like glycosyltransferase
MSRNSKVWLALLLTTLVVRLLSLSAYPLFDTTEARYSEIARLMLVSGDWITPYIREGVPFWGKPPLSFWLATASFKVFGLGEFAARLPSFLLALATSALIWRFGATTLSREATVAAAAILLTSAMGFFSAGAVMTEASLIFATTLSMLAFWMVTFEHDRRWQYIYFLGLAIGLLAKGPIALVLIGVPTLAWMLYYRGLAWSIRCMPWVSGTLLMLAVAAPWYLLAELKTPGFIEYFLVGEHWLRFVENDWQGDLYGQAHGRPRGTIWVYWITAVFPWSLLAVFALFKTWWRRAGIRRYPTESQGYLLLWALTPLVFFTFSGAVLPAYVLPGIPAFALLLGEWLTKTRSPGCHVGWLIPVLFAAILLGPGYQAVTTKSERELINHLAATSPTTALIYYPEKPFSASFYSRGSGSVLLASDDIELERLLNKPGNAFVAIYKRAVDTTPPSIMACLRFERRFSRFFLFEKSALRCPIGAAGD